MIRVGRFWITITGQLVFLVFLLGCSSGGKKIEEERMPERVISVPRFNGDSAFIFVKEQVAFGPRVPNSEAHKNAGDYLIHKLKVYGAEVVTQEFDAPSYHGKQLQLRNIIGSYGLEKEKRILLAAHWDTRPFADKDSSNPTGPMDGANDGASGVGVLLEMARLIQGDTSLQVGVDIIFFDGEDWGEPETAQGQRQPPKGWDSWWCMGSQYWSRNKHKPNYAAYYGILLDMVGAKRSQFFREGASLQYAPGIVAKIWNMGARLGYGDYFVKQNAHAITDDHIYVNEWAKIPMVDIVHYQQGIGYFGDYHHSQKDNMDLISKETLEAVGATLLNVIYYEE
ncbi:MAG TPA: peptidase [Cytophagales bacterium]|nr:peptidase [Cytophagales bacterium]